MTTMKLSQAIRAGARRYQQTFGIVAKDNSDGIWSVCALGAAYVGVFGKIPDPDIRLPTQQVIDALDESGLPVNYMIRVPMELQNTHSQSYERLADIIADLNNEPHWSFERIATWLEGFDQ